MGSTDSKLDASIVSSRSSTTGQASSIDSDVVLVRAPCGVRLRRLEGNNFLGRLADARKFTARGGGVGGIGLLSSLPQRLARATDSSGGSAGSGGCVTPAADSGCISPTLQRAQPSLPPMTSTPIWSLAGGHQYHPQHRGQPERRHQHEHHHRRHHRQQQQHGPGVQHAVPPSNLTALLARGFDPAEYERREREHRRRVAKARPRQNEKCRLVEPLHKD